MQKFSVGEALRFGWSTMKANFWFFVGLILTIIALQVLLPGLMTGFREQKEFTVMGFIANVVAWVFSVIIGIGTTKIFLMFVDGQKPPFSELFAHVNLFWRYFGAQLLASLIVGLGFLLLIVPGIIWALKYSFVAYFVVDKGMGPSEALRHSARITKGVKWQLLLFWFVLGLVNVAGALVLLIGLFATIPMSMVAAAFVYRKLANTLEPAVAGQPINGQAT